MKESLKEQFDVIVIGAGASGLVAAIKAASFGARAGLIERNNNPGKKLYATGNGRCNYMNSNFNGFKIIKEELEKLGIIGEEEEEGRIYPRSRQAKSVVDALVLACEKSGVNLICDTLAKAVAKNDQGYVVKSKDGKTFLASCVIVCTGGKAGIQYGSYGDGYMWAGNLGHSLVKPIPALTGLIPSASIEDLHGVRCLANVSFLRNGRVLAKSEGELQFTKDSISGICVMNLSKYFRIENPSDEFELSINFFPGLSQEEIASLLENQEKLSGHKLFGLLPDKLANYIEHQNKDLACDILSTRLTDYRFALKGTKGWADAQVTCGGIPISELSENWESKLSKGLYFAGEICDYDGPCGGYNLSYAFLSGLRAGEAAAKEALCKIGQTNKEMQ